MEFCCSCLKSNHALLDVQPAVWPVQPASRLHVRLLFYMSFIRRNCLVKQIIEVKIKGQIEVTRRRGSRYKKLLDDLKDRRGYCQLKEEAVDRTMWMNRFGRGFGPVV